VVKGSLGQQRRASPEFLATIRRECIECGHRPLVGSGRCRILVMPHQPRRMTMETEPQTINSTPPRDPWNKGKLIGQKPPLRPKHVWSIRTRLQMGGTTGGGRITIKTQNVTIDRQIAASNPKVKPGSYVMSVVSDSGIGMTPAVL